ncbi:MAG: hypothetical protein WCS27_07755 [Victivallaceae bacterium]
MNNSFDVIVCGGGPAGFGAAVSVAELVAGIVVSNGIDPEDVDGKYLRAQLIAVGAEL